MVSAVVVDDDEGGSRFYPCHDSVCDGGGDFREREFAEHDCIAFRELRKNVLYFLIIFLLCHCGGVKRAASRVTMAFFEWLECEVCVHREEYEVVIDALFEFKNFALSDAIAEDEHLGEFACGRIGE